MNLLPATTLSGDNRIHVADLFALCDTLPAGSVDMILADLPDGTTECKWDSVIAFAPMWKQFERVIKPNGAIVLTAAQPFSSALVMSNPSLFRHEWIWKKNHASNFMNAKSMPLKVHEVVLVFSLARGRGNQFVTDQLRYFPQGVTEINRTAKGKTKPSAVNHMRSKLEGHYTQTHSNYPQSVINYEIERGLHPTQKPVALFEYLIRTYTQAGELVFDPCVGSGTTAVACVNTGRRFICGDQSAEYVAIARERVRKAQTEARQLELIAEGV